MFICQQYRLSEGPSFSLCVCVCVCVCVCHALRYDPGPKLNVSVDGVMAPDYIAPGATNIYVVGCAATSAATPDPSIEFAAPLLHAQGITGATDVTTPGWTVQGTCRRHALALALADATIGMWHCIRLGLAVGNQVVWCKHLL